MAAFGATAFGIYAVDPIAVVPNEHAFARFDGWNNGLLQLSAWGLLISGLVILPLVAARMAGNESVAVDPRTIALVLHDTEFGHVWCLHLLFATLLIMSATIAPHRRALNLSWAALALASLGWVGHA